MHLSYEDRLKLVAYTQQATHGPLDISSAPPLGVLDVIGRDRRAAWQALGQTSQIQAMAGFIHTLDRLIYKIDNNTNKKTLICKSKITLMSIIFIFASLRIIIGL